jgi:hypothetical protein
MTTFTWIALVVIFIAVLLTLILTNIRDSNKRLNNALLIFYFAVSMWIVAGLGGVFSQVYSTISQAQIESRSSTTTQRGRVTTRGKKNQNGHYTLIWWGLVILSGVYVIRRPEWAGMVVDGLGAWKGKDLDRGREMLIQYAISNPEDRDWVQSFLIEIETKRVEKESDKPEEDHDLEIVPPDIIPK